MRVDLVIVYTALIRLTYVRLSDRVVLGYIRRPLRVLDEGHILHIHSIYKRVIYDIV